MGKLFSAGQWSGERYGVHTGLPSPAGQLVVLLLSDSGVHNAWKTSGEGAFEAEGSSSSTLNDGTSVVGEDVESVGALLGFGDFDGALLGCIDGRSSAGFGVAG